MSGVDIVGALLREYEPLTGSLVPVERIKAGALPDGIALSALLIRLVSSIDRQKLKRSATVRVTERISVTVRSASYREQRAVIKLVKACCRGRVIDMGDGSRASVLTAGTGPDVAGPANSFEQTQDLRVSFDEPS